MTHSSASTMHVVINDTESIVVVIWIRNVIPRAYLVISVHKYLKRTLSKVNTPTYFNASRENSVFLTHPDTHIVNQVSWLAYLDRDDSNVNFITLGIVDKSVKLHVPLHNFSRLIGIPSTTLSLKFESLATNPQNSWVTMHTRSVYRITCDVVVIVLLNVLFE